MTEQRPEPEQDADESGQLTDQGVESEPPQREGQAGPAEDLETDPAYSPDDPQLKRIKGG